MLIFIGILLTLVFFTLLSATVKHLVNSRLRDVRREAFSIGLKEGYDAGHEDGYQAGLRDEKINLHKRK